MQAGLAAIGVKCEITAKPFANMMTDAATVDGGYIACPNGWTQFYKVVSLTYCSEGGQPQEQLALLMQAVVFTVVASTFPKAITTSGALGFSSQPLQ